MADIIDINVLETVEEVTINVVDNVIQVNINKITSTAVTNTSELINDGEDGVHPYITLLDLPSNLILYPTTVASDVIGYVKLVTDIHDPEYNVTAVNVSTGSITTTNQLISSLITVPNLINGNPGVFNISTVGNIRRSAGSGTAEFYFNVYKRDALGVETLIGVSNPTLPASSAVYAEFNSTAIWDDGIFTDTDRVVLKFYANRISGGSNPTYEFQFGGLTPVRTLVPIPLSVVPNNPTLEEVLIAGNTATDLSITLDNTVGITSTYIDSEQILISDNVSNESSSINPLLIGVSDNAQSISVFKNRISRYKSNFVSDITFTDPTANRNITFKDASGTIALTSDIPAPITIDATPTDGSANAVSSNGVFDALATKFTLPTLTSGSVLFSNGTTIAQDNANLFWDDTNNRLGIGTNAPNSPLHLSGSITATSAIARGENIATTLIASANNDNLVGLDINPVFTNGAFTGVSNNLFRASSVGVIRTVLDNFGRQEWYLNSGTAEVGRIRYSTPGAFPGIIFETGATYNQNRFNVVNSGTFFGMAFNSDGTGDKRLTVFTNGVGVNTSVPAGFGFDVNGTTRLNGNTSIGGATAGARLDVRAQGALSTDIAFRVRNSADSANLVDINGAGGVSINSTTQGFLPPRMTTTQKNAIASPVAGLVVYDSTLNKLCVRTASAWETITSI